MRKILILALSTLSLSAFAQSAAEEAIILNQELQFLEDSINTTQALSINTLDVDANRNRAINDESLERTYFGTDVEEDVVNTKTASPKRRGL